MSSQPSRTTARTPNRQNEETGQRSELKDATNRISKKRWTERRPLPKRLAKELMDEVAKLTSGEVTCDAKVMEAIMSSYRKRRSVSGTGMNLTGGDLDELIAVFGTWCLPEDAPPSSYKRPVLRGEPLATDQLEPYWEFVSELQEDKQRLTGELSLTDEFWALQKAIYRARLAKSKTSAGITTALNQVDTLYRQSRHRFTSPDFHLAFFQTAFMFRCTFNRVCSLFCDYVEANPDGLPSGVAAMLWRMVLNLNVPDRLKQRLVTLVASRILCPPRPTNELQSLLVSTIVSSPRTPKTSTLPYIGRLSRESFDPSLPLASKWDNLRLLAMLMHSESCTTPVQVDKLEACPQSRTWRTVLFLAFLRTTLKQVDLSTNDILPLADGLHPVLQKLWDAWIAVPTALRPSVDVDRAITTSFLEVAGWIRHEVLLRHCFQFSWKSNLHWMDSREAESSVADLFASYIVSLARCRAYQWTAIFPHVKATVPQDVWDKLLPRVAHKLLPHGAQCINSFRSFLTSQGIELPAEASLKLAVSLVKGQEWAAALEILSSSKFSPPQAETLAISFLRMFQIQRREVIPSSFATQLSDVLSRIYAQDAPSPHARYPIRYFIKILITVGQGAKALDLVKRIFHHDQTFFTQRVIRRYMVQLVAKQNSVDAIRLVLLFQNTFKPAELADLNRKLAMGFHVAESSWRETKALQKFKSPTRRSQTPRERMMRGVRLRKHTRPRTAHLLVTFVANKVSPRSPSYIPAIRFAISFLVKKQRMFAARKLYARAWPNLDPKTHTLFGNIILHGCFELGLTKRRLPRHIFHTMNLLRDNYGFKPDRATVNIITKILILSCPQNDARPLRALFDEFIRRGYPAGERVLREDDVPFGTTQRRQVATLWNDIPWPDPAKTIVFHKHVQPLYKMFITAFYLRGDVAGAKTVLAAMKDAKFDAIQELEKRNAARREGIVRKKAKLARLAAQKSGMPSR